MGHDQNWALEFKCKIGDLDIVGVDLITLGEDGLIDISKLEQVAISWNIGNLASLFAPICSSLFQVLEQSWTMHLLRNGFQ